MMVLVLLSMLAARPPLALETRSLYEHAFVLEAPSAVRVEVLLYGDGCSSCRCSATPEVDVDAALHRLTVRLEGPDRESTSTPCRALPITTGTLDVGPLDAGSWTVVHPGLSIQVEQIEPKPRGR